jgi:hypothetical protein
MELQRQHPTTERTVPAGSQSVERPGGANLAEQARKYAEVARRAREQCQSGRTAEEELLNRRNRSGQ